MAPAASPLNAPRQSVSRLRVCLAALNIISEHIGTPGIWLIQSHLRREHTSEDTLPALMSLQGCGKKI